NAEVNVNRVASIAGDADLRPLTTDEHPTEPASTAAPAEGPVTVRNYVIFTTRTLQGVGTVTTGWQFADSTADRPDFQWCYLLPDQGQQDGTTARIDLPKTGQPAVAATALSRHGLDRSEIMQAQGLCVWTAER